MPDTNIKVQASRPSAREKFVAPLFLQPRCLMAIIPPDPLALYCDASGKETDPIIVVAGAVSSVQHWLRFDEQWTQALLDNNLEYFRMSEFAHSTGQFKYGWKGSEDRRQQFLKRLVRIAMEHIQCWIGAAVRKSDYDRADAVYQVREFLQPYPLCSINCVELALEWARNQKLDYLPMEFVFEAGDEHWGQFHQRMLEDYNQAPIPKTKDQATPLQLADFAAYEIRKVYQSVEDEGIQPMRFRNSLGLLLVNIDHRWGHQTDIGIRTLMNVRGVARR
jgi:hypothetical protein